MQRGWTVGIDRCDLAYRIGGVQLLFILVSIGKGSFYSDQDNYISYQLLILPMFSDGKEIMQCSGIVVDWNKTSRLATIVTCSAAVCFDGALVHPNPKVCRKQT